MKWKHEVVAADVGVEADVEVEAVVEASLEEVDRFHEHRR